MKCEKGIGVVDINWKISDGREIEFKRAF